MSVLFTLLMLASIVCLIIGLASPTTFSKVFKKNATRGKLALIFGGAFILFIILIGVTAPPTKTDDKKTAITAEVAKTLTPEEQAKKDADDALAKKQADEAKAKQEAEAKAQADEAKAKQEAEDKANNVPAEYKSALNKASSYANTMNMSKLGVYDQLVSEYGEQFSADAAQYAIDNVKADWNVNALVKAKTYQDTMSMSPAAIHDQLTSQYGEKFTQAEADYAIQHLNN